MSDLLKDSIELYSKSDLKTIERMLKNAEVIVHEEDNKLSPDSREIISKMLETEREKVEKVIEKFEFEKLYKYSSIFEVSSPSDDLQEKLDSLIHNEEKITTEDVPTVIKTEKLYIIKFLKRCVGVKLIEGIPRTYSVRYPMLAVYYPEYNVIETRVHTISRFLRNDESDFYNERISEIRRDIESKFAVNLDAMPLDQTVNFIAENDGNVKVSSQKMQLANGGDATLNSSQSSDETVLPILGELDAIIKDNSDLFEANEECQQIKQLLEDFIKDTEETSELPWRSLRWPNEIKRRVIQVKFNFVNLLSDNSNDFTLMEYYTNGRGIEGMNYVTKYIIEKYRESGR
ncbi:hypothetical protein [Streptococcus sp. oral taxon 061]|uniref:hypothetical protein n=1 Tax=Streptococcus sp. oral taxon 061 TaxID=712623 RepID=UPI0034D6E507